MEAKRVLSQSSKNFLQITIFLVAFLPFITRAQSSSPTTPPTNSTTNAYNNYLKTACNTTRYPVLCYRSLSSYTDTIKTNDHSLCDTALNISLKAATNTSKLVTRILSTQDGLNNNETKVVKVCIDQIGASIDELQQSLKTLGSLSGHNVKFQIGSVKTWVSAAISDDATCIDGFDERTVDPLVKKRISSSINNVAKLTSNALALINHMKH